MNIGDDTSRKGQYAEYLKSELEAAAMYAALAETERDSERAEVFHELVGAEMRHAARWAEKLGMDPQTLEPASPGLRLRLVQLLARLFGTNRVVPVLLRSEAKEVNTYADDPEARDLVIEERGHARMLRDLARPGAAGLARSPAGLVGGAGSVRAAVLGVNDGLVSKFQLGHGCCRRDR